VYWVPTVTVKDLLLVITGHDIGLWHDGVAWFEEARDEFSFGKSLGNGFQRIPVGRLVPLRAAVLGLESRGRCPSCIML
jgi:hypothetical protein